MSSILSFLSKPGQLIRNVMVDPSFMQLPEPPAAAAAPAASYNCHETSILPARLVRRMMRSRTWLQYRKGALSWEQAARHLSSFYGISENLVLSSSMRPDIIAATFLHAAIPFLLQLRRALRQLGGSRSQSSFNLICVFNFSPEEMHELQRTQALASLFSIFGTAFTSGEVGMVKPSLCFFKLVMARASIRAQETVFLDMDLESIVAARSLGISSLLLTADQLELHSESGNIQVLQLPFNAHVRAEGCTQKSASHKVPIIDGHEQTSSLLCAHRFLQQPEPSCEGLNMKNGSLLCQSLTSDGIRICDNFAQFVIAELLEDKRFLPMQSPPPHGRIKFIRNFNGKDKSFHASDSCTYKDIPDDLDTTSIGLSVLHHFGYVDDQILHNTVTQMLEFVSADDAILQVYFDNERPRVDPVVAANGLFLFHLTSRASEVTITETFVESVLLNRAYLDGTLYYNSSSAFLFFVARLVHAFEAHFRMTGMRSLLEARLAEHATFVEESDALSLAMHIIACSFCGFESSCLEYLREKLVGIQNDDGSWGCHPFYRYGNNAQSWIGNETLTTAFAIKALSVTRLFVNGQIVAQ